MKAYKLARRGFLAVVAAICALAILAFRRWIAARNGSVDTQLASGAGRLPFDMTTRDTDVLRKLFTREIPEIASGAIEIKAVARKPGRRSKVALRSTRADVDCISACVGERGKRIKKIVDTLNYEPHEVRSDSAEFERVDLVRWNDDIDVLIRNSLQPYAVHIRHVDKLRREAAVSVVRRHLPNEEPLGRLNEHVELANEICGYSIKIAYEM